MRVARGSTSATLGSLAATHHMVHKAVMAASQHSQVRVDQENRKMEGPIVAIPRAMSRDHAGFNAETEATLRTERAR
jgi:hypothetical protein